MPTNLHFDAVYDLFAEMLGQLWVVGVRHE
jgi:hypothetical protein